MLHKYDFFFINFFNCSGQLRIKNNLSCLNNNICCFHRLFMHLLCAVTVLSLITATTSVPFCTVENGRQRRSWIVRVEHRSKDTFRWFGHLARWTWRCCSRLDHCNKCSTLHSLLFSIHFILSLSLNCNLFGVKRVIVLLNDEFWEYLNWYIFNQGYSYTDSLDYFSRKNKIQRTAFTRI